MIKLHFYSNETLYYKSGLGIGPMWAYLKKWRDIAADYDIQIHISSSPKEEEITKYRKQCTGKDHPLPDRHRTILEVNNKLIYFDCQDQILVGADLHLVPNIFELCIKFQYCPGLYDNVPFKVSPFTYFCLTEDHILAKYRKIRKEIHRNRAFKHSILWAGVTRPGKQNRRDIHRYLAKHSKKALVGFFESEEYYQHICESVVGVSAKGGGEFCHRDIEFMGIGTPFFRKTFNTEMYHPITPFLHYYAIGGDKIGMNRTMRHFVPYFEPNGELKQFSKNEWKEYEEISEKAMTWYDQNATFSAIYNC